MKKIIALALTLLFLTGCAAGPAQAGFRQIDAREAAELMESESDYILIDVRTPEEFASGHIPGAINLPNESIGSQEPPQLPARDQMILVYCRSGNRSKQAAQKLADLGYTNVVEFGGIRDWAGPIVTD